MSHNVSPNQGTDTEIKVCSLHLRISNFSCRDCWRGEFRVDNKVDLPSRIAVRPVSAGVLLTLALMIFLSSSVRNFFLATNAHVGPFGELAVWFALTLIWTGSVFFGSVVAALSARATSRKDGVLQGLTVWAASYLGLGVLIAAKEAGYEPILELDQLNDFLVFRDFLSELFAISFGVLGGLMGSRWENLGFRKKHVEPSKPKVALTNPIPHPL
jgi:hypothetical protein